MKINHPDDKHHDHQKLPFKAVDCQAMQVFTIVAQHTFSISEIVPGPTEIKKSIRKQQYYTNAYLNSIWQPPRFS